ncbi:MAG: cytochrome c biogenesis protein [Gemmataceae bacterium]|jgi:ABC-type transport system involved in cytochrome c biogenesis permease subunit
MQANKYLLPGIVVLGGFLYLFAQAAPNSQPANSFNLQGFGQLPVVDRGRIKPIDTFARVSLMVMNDGFQSFKDESGARQPAVRWLLDVMTSRFSDKGTAEKLKVIRIENDQLLGVLSLQPRPGLRYSINEFSKQLPALEERAKAAEQKEPAKRNTLDRSVLQLAHHLQSYIEIASLQTPLIIPADKELEWKPFMQAAIEAKNANRDDPATKAFGNMILAYERNEPGNFNKSLEEYRGIIDKSLPAEAAISKFEVFFNHFSPFYHCIVLYIFVFLIAALAWAFRPESINRSAFWLCTLTLIVHTWALLARMYIQGRPPVTNLYSSAVFIGWGCVLGCVILEAIYKNGVGNIVGSVTGALTLLIAQHLGGEGDTLEMMQAVLDTNFWLATHVTCITLGYTTSFVAGFLGIFYVLRGVFTPTLTAESDKSLTQMTYGIICFAMLFSFIGTVLGGIWADQSWGRFWGWDPKENGALLIVIWNAVILHARWGGMVKNRGIALLSIVGNMVTGWSWFGTNQLGVGLHAYGFNDQLARGLTMFWISQLVVLAIGLFPKEKWWSVKARKQPVSGIASGIKTKHQPA